MTPHRSLAQSFLLVLVAACAGTQPPATAEAQTASAVSPKGLETLSSLEKPEVLEKFGWSLGQVDSLPEDDGAAVSALVVFLDEARGTMGPVWPGEILATTRQGHRRFFSVVPDGPMGNDFRQGYMVDADTMNVHSYNFW